MWITQGHKQVCSLACFPANLLFQLHVNQPKQGCWACTFLVTTCETAICLDAFVHLSNASNVPHADAGERISRVSSSPGMDASCRSGGEYRAKQRDAKQADDKLADEESDGLVMCSLNSRAEWESHLPHGQGPPPRCGSYSHTPSCFSRGVILCIKIFFWNRLLFFLARCRGGEVDPSPCLPVQVLNCEPPGRGRWAIGGLDNSLKCPPLMIN